MRKLLIASVSVLALSAGAAFAQSPYMPGNSSGVNQIGSNNSATIEQALGTGSSNNSQVNQGYYSWDPIGGMSGYTSSSTNGVASVTQIGGNGSVINSSIQQTDAGQHATVTQDGSAGGSQSSNIWQSTGSTASSPAGNSATLRQTTVGGGTQNSGISQENSGNIATVTQTTARSTDYQQSSVYQGGANGLVTVTQTGPNDNSNVNQYGNGNNALWTGATTVLGAVSGGVSVNQGGLASNNSSVYQSSDFSGVAVLQDGTGGSNWSNVWQSDGVNNTAGVWQTAGAGTSNWSNISQSGSLNVASVRQH